MPVTDTAQASEGKKCNEDAFQATDVLWFDNYDIYDEYGNTLFVVKGQLSRGIA